MKVSQIGDYHELISLDIKRAEEVLRLANIFVERVEHYLQKE